MQRLNEEADRVKLFEENKEVEEKAEAYKQVSYEKEKRFHPTQRSKKTVQQLLSLILIHMQVIVLKTEQTSKLYIKESRKTKEGSVK